MKSTNPNIWSAEVRKYILYDWISTRPDCILTRTVFSDFNLMNNSDKLYPIDIYHLEEKIQIIIIFLLAMHAGKVGYLAIHTGNTANVVC